MPIMRKHNTVFDRHKWIHFICILCCILAFLFTHWFPPVYSELVNCKVVQLQTKLDESALGRLIFRIRRCTIASCDEQWFMMRRYHIPVNNDFLYVRTGWDIIHYVKKHIFYDGA